MVFQWLAGIVASLLISPTAWAGAQSQPHIHVWAAIFLGGAISLVPIVMVLALPGRTLTRHVVAIAQMFTSGLLIHLSGGRIETHFHYFGSLAFLAFYRDWHVLINRLDCRWGRPLRSRRVFPAIDLWSGRGRAMAMGRTRRVGRFYGFFSDYFDRAEPEGNERYRPRSRALGNRQRQNRTGSQQSNGRAPRERTPTNCCT